MQNTDQMTMTHRLGVVVEKLRESAYQKRKVRNDRLVSLIERLRKVTFDEFIQREWPRFQMLNELFGKGWGLPVPALSVCGSGTAEVRFTKLLAYYFDYRNPHGLGGLLAEAVFRDTPGIPDDLSFAECTAEAEVSLGQTERSDGSTVSNYLDLLLNVDSFKILIEQKVTSSEGHEQTPRYTKAMQARFENDNKVCFFLTPQGREAKDKDTWKPLSHRQLINRMAKVLNRHALSPSARHNLCTLIWDLMVGPLAQNELWITDLKQEVKKIAGDVKKYPDLRRWFMRFNFGKEERLTLLSVIGE